MGFSTILRCASKKLPQGHSKFGARAAASNLISARLAPIWGRKVTALWRHGDDFAPDVAQLVSPRSSWPLPHHRDLTLGVG